VKRGAAGPRGNRQRRRAWEGFARGNQQRRARGPRAYTSRRDVSGEVADLGGQREKERAGGRRHLESSSGERSRLLQSSVPALQSHGSSPFSNRSASSSSSPTNLGGFPPLPLHPRAPGCSSASLPAPFPQLHRFLFLSSSFPLLSCFCLC